MFSKSKSHLSQEDVHKTLDSLPSTLMQDHRTNTCNREQASFKTSQAGTMNYATRNLVFNENLQVAF